MLMTNLSRCSPSSIFSLHTDCVNVRPDACESQDGYMDPSGLGPFVAMYAKSVACLHTNEWKKVERGLGRLNLLVQASTLR